MRLRHLFLSLLAFLAMTAATVAEPLKKGDRVVFLVDSITQAGAGPNGYGTLVREALAKDHKSLEGEVIGPNTEVLRKITAFAGGRTKVEVDCSLLRRMDFVSAGTLFNIVSQLHAQGRLVVFKGVNSMVAALMQVMSLHQVARIELRG